VLVGSIVLVVVDAGLVVISIVGANEDVDDGPPDVVVDGPAVAVVVVVPMHDPHVVKHCALIKSRWQKVFSKLCSTPLSFITVS